MKKYWYIPTGNKVWFDAAKSLYTKGIACPVFWTGDDRHFKSAKKLFGNSVYSKQILVFYPEEINKIQYEALDNEFFLSINYSKAKDRCLKMMDRLDIYGNFSRLDRDVIFNKLAMWILNKFHETKPDALICSENPHSHTHYLIYEICLYKNIEILKFNTWLPIPVLYGQNLRTGKRLIIRNKIEKRLSVSLEEFLIDFIDKYLALKRTGEYTLPSISDQKNALKLRNKLFNFFKHGLLKQIKEFWFQFRKYFSKNYYPINPFKLGYLTRSRIKNIRERNLSKAFKYSQVNVDLTRKFVYYALNFEPERTTNPDGDEFHDQVIALTYLRKFLPLDYSIFVREHPTQFLRIGKGSRGRSPLFYEVIQNLKGVFLVNQNIDSLELIRRSSFTASISGSVAFESAILGKRSLVFGDTWYEGCPNITKWSDALLFEEFIVNPISNTEKIKKFLIEQKNLYCVAGCQNISAQKRFRNFLNKDFEKEELVGVTQIIENFLLN